LGLEPKYLSSRGKPVAAPMAIPEAPPVTLRSVDQIYRDEASAIRVFVQRIVRTASDAEDLVQATFLRSWPALASGAVDCPRAFLFRTARTLALDHIRNSRVRN